MRPFDRSPVHLALEPLVWAPPSLLRGHLSSSSAWGTLEPPLRDQKAGGLLRVWPFLVAWEGVCLG